MESSHADEEPPEIEHITVGYQPLSKLITRLAQDTFNNLREVIDAMAEMSVSPTPNGHNPPKLLNSHVTVNGDDENSTNIQKKMRLMNFAQDRRAQFIKALVLTQWSRQSEDVSKVIDLKVWLDRQRYLYDEAWYWLGDLKRSLEPAKLPNPDLRTAVEVLSTGKASWLPKVSKPGIVYYLVLWHQEKKDAYIVLAWIYTAHSTHAPGDAQDPTQYKRPPDNPTQPP